LIFTMVIGIGSIAYEALAFVRGSAPNSFL
jgi:hypothetical protein